MGDPLKAIGDFFKKIGRAFDAIRGVQQGMQDIFEGLAIEFAAGPIGFAYAVKDMFELSEYIFLFISTHLECLNKISSNYTLCFLTYTVDFFLGFLLMIPCVCIYITCFVAGWNYNDKINIIKDGAESLDATVYGMVGQHIFHWPKFIRDSCYNCKRLKMTSLMNKTVDIQYDLTGRVANLLVSGLMKIFGGVGKITDALNI